MTGWLFDLDGVVYTGRAEVPGAGAALRDLASRGPVGFVTNNASRSNSAMAKHIRSFGVDIDDRQVMTSAVAGAQCLSEELAAGSRVLIVGSEFLAQCVEQAGLKPVRPTAELIDELDSRRQQVDAVLQGLAANVGNIDLCCAIAAVRAGARFCATNPDLRMPKETGFFPGNGSFVRIVQECTGIVPEVYGKPEATMLTLAARAQNMSGAVMVGDQIATDIAAGKAAAMQTALVLTGVDSVHSALALPPAQQPDVIASSIATVRAAVEDTPTVRCDADAAQCGAARVRCENSRITHSGPDNHAVAAALALSAHLDRPLDAGTLPERFV
ncbi:HAD-IIA family hydrolase [Brevibacterium sp. HMSC063G07]|uniref:HAD-IIA family hydrolase n=1 Tax=Brevibacterium sp. HMSC063G07 TaxID=1739261 RepID=UPI0008A40AAF|nr:HAD-IIA family hydrolase [Brevibacterium sp. HMSC063G07]OFL64354.1 hypothetical protein HMPREF2757_00035 [Brevibacterium sp. HMSC063G07]